MALEPFLIYPASIKLGYEGQEMTFDSPQAAKEFINSTVSLATTQWDSPSHPPASGSSNKNMMFLSTYTVKRLIWP